MIHRFANNPIIRGSAFLAFGTFVSGALGYGVQVLLARWLPVAAFGDFGALLAIASIAAMPFGTLTFLVVRTTAEHVARGDERRLHDLLRSVTRVSVVCAFIAVVALIAAGGLFTEFFRITSRLAYTLIMLALVPGAILAVVRGYFQGRQWFGFFTITAIVEASVKFIAVAALLVLGWGILGAAFAITVTPFIVLAIFLPKARALFRVSGAASVPWRQAARAATSPLLAFFALSAFLQVDLLVVKHWFVPADAGLYNGIVLLGRVVFFLAGAVTGALIPVAVSQYATNPMRARRSLFEAVGLVVLCGIGVMFVEWMASARLVTLLLGQQFASVAWLLPPYTAMIIVFAIAFLLANFLISIRARGVARVLGVGLLVEIIALAMFHQSFGLIVGMMGAVFGMITLALGFLVVRILYARTIITSSDVSVPIPILS